MTNAHRATIAFTLLLAGCASERIVKYPRMNTADTIARMAQKQHEIRTVSSEGGITFIGKDGQSVRFDAAMAMSPPDSLRLRAWKFGNAVLDLTLTPNGVWVVSPDDAEHKDQIHSAGASAARIARTWSLLAGQFFDSADLQAEEKGDRLILTRPWEENQHVRCEVERSTLTARRYTLLDDKSVAHFTLDLDRYADFSGVVWPQRVIATSDAGKVVIELRSLEFNSDLPAAAFKPPRRAEKLP